MRSARQVAKTITILLPGLLLASYGAQCAPPVQHAVATAPGLAAELAIVADGTIDSGTGDTPALQHLHLGQQDPLALLVKAQAQWEGAAGYSLTLHTRERLGKVLGSTSVIEAKVMRQPRAVAFRWLSAPGRIDRLIWMPSRYDGKLIVRPTGLLGGLLKVVRLDPGSDRVRSTSRSDVTQFGLANTLQRLVEDYRSNLAAGNLTSECIGPVVWGSGNLPALLLKRTTTGRDNESRTVLLWLGADDLRPLQLKQFGWSDELLASYSFSDYRPMKLSGEAFTLAAMGMD